MAQATQPSQGTALTDTHKATIPFPSLKFLLQRRDGVQVRRIGGASFSFEEIQTLMAQWWEGAHVTYRYTDCDGDVVTIGSEPEWRECLHHHAELGLNPVRLKVAKVPKARPRAAPLPVPAPPVEAIAAAMHALNPTTGESTVIPVEEPTVDAARALLVALFGDVVVRKLWSGGDVAGSDITKVAKVLGCTPGNSWDPSHQVDVDIDLGALRAAASKHGLAMLGVGNNEGARDVLSLATKLPLDNENDDVIIRYNLACAHALLGSSEAALKELTLAIEHGYTDGTHMAKDEDLVSLHGHDAFQALVRRLCPPTPTADAMPEPVHVPAEAVVPQRPVAPVDPKVEYLMAIFPTMDAETAGDMLRHARGDMRGAIELFLGA